MNTYLAKQNNLISTKYKMKELLNRLDTLLEKGKTYCDQADKEEMSSKPNPKKWSKQEILGHLIDSGINNLQRFTEIQFEDKPYKIRKYSQEGLVNANDYQNSEIKELVGFWMGINNRIKNVIELQTEASLKFQIELDNGTISDLRFLIVDYVDHMEHHINQITKSS